MKMKKHITKKIKKLAVSKMNSITVLIVILSLLIIHIPLPVYAAEDEIMSAAEDDTNAMADADTDITSEDTSDVTPESEQNPTPEETPELSPQSVTEEEVISGDFKYKETSSGAAITGYTGNEDILKLPSMIDGIKVTSIGTNAFYWCTFREIILPEGTPVKSIGDRKSVV